MSIWETTKTVMKYTSPLNYLIIEGAEKAAKSISTASEEGLDPLKAEMAKQTIKMQFAQQQARIEQELAIARRIDNADEVEIEEFYDTSGKGNLGITIDQKSESASIGLGAEGRVVTKRVYRFKGRHSQDCLEIEQNQECPQA